MLEYLTFLGAALIATIMICAIVAIGIGPIVLVCHLNDKGVISNATLSLVLCALWFIIYIATICFMLLKFGAC